MTWISLDIGALAPRPPSHVHPWNTDHLLKSPAALKNDLEGANLGFVAVAVLQ